MNDEAKKFGAQGGKKRAANLTKEQRSEAARLAAVARWGKDLPVAEYAGVLRIGDLELPCAVLSDGTRVLTEMEFMKAMLMYRSGALSVRREQGGAQEPLYLAFKNLKPFVDKHLKDAHEQTLPFRTLTGQIAHGIRADVIVDICKVWTDAHAAGVLGPRQVQIAEKAQVLLDALTVHGIRQLVDAATGFQALSDQQEIARFLALYVHKELRQWVATFPRTFFEQLCRLKGVPFPKGDMRLPRYFGKIINELVYTRIAPGVLPELRAVNPVVGPNGRRRNKHHQHMTDNVGNPKLQNLIGRLEGIAYGFADGDYDGYKKAVDRLIPNYGDLPLFRAGDIPKMLGEANAKLALPAASESEPGRLAPAG